MNNCSAPRTGHETVFFPGCALRNLAPELCQLSFAWLKERGIALSQFDACCNKRLVYQGEQDAFTKKGEKLFRRLSDQGISRIITACPNCYYSLKELRKETNEAFEIVAFSEVLVDEGVVFSAEKYPDARFTVHDSCPDRQDQVFGDTLRILAQNLSLVEMEHARARSLCCGIGDIFYHADRTVQEQQADRRIQEAEKAHATHILCGCINCTLTLRQRISINKPVHYLELFFDREIGVPPTKHYPLLDWEQGEG